jgi:WD40 repeat protein
MLAGITGDNGEIVTTWRASTGQVIATFGCGLGGCQTVAFSPDGGRVLTADADGTARLFDARSGALVRTFTGHSQAVNDARFLPHGRRVITASADGTARVWDVRDGHELLRFAGHTDNVVSVAVSSDGRSAFTTSWDHTIRRWRTDGPIAPVTFVAGTGSVQGLAFSSDDRLLAIGSSDRLQVRDVAQGSLTLDVALESSQALAFAPDDQRLAVATSFGSSVWDVVSGRQLFSLGPSGHEPLPYIVTAAYGPGGTTLLASDGDGGLALWDPATGDKVRSFSGVGGAAALSPDGSSVAYTSAVLCGQVVVANARSGIAQRYISITTGGGSGIQKNLCAIDLAFTPDGKELVISDTGHRPRIWDSTAGTVIREFAQPGTVWVVRVGADGRFVLTGGSDGAARLWDLATARLVRLFPKHGGISVAGAAISPDGTLVAIGGDNGSVVVTPLTVEALEAQVCSAVLRDLTAGERIDYGIEGTTAACP